MARAVEDHWDGPLEGLVVTRYGHGADCRRIEVIEAAHPVPDAAGIDAASRILELVLGAGRDDLVLCLISGGGSALLTMPAGDVTLDEKQAINRQLLNSGAPIDAMNIVRKHLSAIKGGRLAAAAQPARVVTLAISDVPGDDPAVIASGPTVPDRSTASDAAAVLERYQIDVPASVHRHLAKGEALPALAKTDFRLIATPQKALEAAGRYCLEHGIRPVILGDAVEGEARDVAGRMARFMDGFLGDELTGDRPVAFLSGGETTVTVKGRGRGGRNAEFLLALGIAFDHRAGICSIACDTDGIDGSEDNAGAIWLPETMDNARANGLDPQAMLDDNNGYGFFSALDALIITGPTLTNVNDFRATVVF